MRKLTYTSRGQSITLTDDPFSPFFMDFNKFYPNLKSGVFDTERTYGQNGLTTYGAALSELTPKMEFTVLGEWLGSRTMPVPRAIDEWKQRLSALFSPLHTGRMIYQNYAGAYILDVRPSGAPAFSDFNILTGTIECAVDFYADRSFWQSEDVYSAVVCTLQEGVTLPLSLPLSFGTYVPRVTIHNPSICDIYPLLTFYEDGGALSVENSTSGDRILLTESVEAGRIVVDTDPYHMTAYAYTQDADGTWVRGENAIYKLSPQSTESFRLLPGDNVIRVLSDFSGSKAAPLVEWRIPYEGV